MQTLMRCPDEVWDVKMFCRTINEEKNCQRDNLDSNIRFWFYQEIQK